MARHIQILGVLNIALGSMSVIGGLAVFLVLSGVAGIAGYSAATSGDDGLPLTAATIGAIGFGLGIFLVALGLPAVIAGIGLLRFRPWARTLSLVLSFFHLFHVPFGTALGVYGFWVLLSEEAQRLLQAGTPMLPSVR